MIPTYYDSPEKLARLRVAAAAVMGTPFFANSEVPGRAGGIDCVHLLNWVHRACGAIDQVAIPRQRMDHGQHSGHSLLIEAFETWPELTARFSRVWRRTDEPEEAPLAELRAALLPGDTLCLRAGRVPHHGGLMLEGGALLHTLRGEGVHTIPLGAVIRGWRILGRLEAVYRPLPRPEPVEGPRPAS